MSKKKKARATAKSKKELRRKNKKKRVSEQVVSMPVPRDEVADWTSDVFGVSLDEVREAQEELLRDGILEEVEEGMIAFNLSE